MAQTWTTTELLTNIREEARIADDEADASDTILLRKATNVLHKIYVPAVRKARSEYYVIEATIPLEEDRVAYPIPRRAATSTVRRVRLVDAQGRETQLAQIPFEDIARGSSSNKPTHYAISDSSLVVYPEPSAGAESYSLRVAFEYRPSQLVAVASAYSPVLYSWEALAPFTTVDSHLFIFDNQDPPFVDGDMVDVIRKDPPFSTVLMDAVVDVTVSASDRFVVSSWIGARERLEAATSTPRYYVCAAGETPIPQIPAELHPVLAKHTAAEWLAPIDPDIASLLKKEADAELKDLLGAMQPRKQGTQMKARARHRMIRGRGRMRGGPIFGDWS